MSREVLLFESNFPERKSCCASCHSEMYDRDETGEPAYPGHEIEPEPREDGRRPHFTFWAEVCCGYAEPKPTRAEWASAIRANRAETSAIRARFASKT